MMKLFKALFAWAVFCTALPVQANGLSRVSMALQRCGDAALRLMGATADLLETDATLRTARSNALAALEENDPHRAFFWIETYMGSLARGHVPVRASRFLESVGFQKLAMNDPKVFPLREGAGKSQPVLLEIRDVRFYRDVFQRIYGSQIRDSLGSWGVQGARLYHGGGEFDFVDLILPEAGPTGVWKTFANDLSEPQLVVRTPSQDGREWENFAASMESRLVSLLRAPLVDKARRLFISSNKFDLASVIKENNASLGGFYLTYMMEWGMEIDPAAPSGWSAAQDESTNSEIYKRNRLFLMTLMSGLKKLKELNLVIVNSQWVNPSHPEARNGVMRAEEYGSIRYPQSGVRAGNPDGTVRMQSYPWDRMNPHVGTRIPWEYAQALDYLTYRLGLAPVWNDTYGRPEWK